MEYGSRLNLVCLMLEMRAQKAAQILGKFTAVFYCRLNFVPNLHSILGEQKISTENYVVETCSSNF